MLIAAQPMWERKWFKGVGIHFLCFLNLNCLQNCMFSAEPWACGRRYYILWNKTIMLKWKQIKVRKIWLRSSFPLPFSTFSLYRLALLIRHLPLSFYTSLIFLPFLVHHFPLPRNINKHFIICKLPCWESSIKTLR